MAFELNENYVKGSLFRFGTTPPQEDEATPEALHRSRASKGQMLLRLAGT
jgi:hypothetical protein